MLHGVIGYGIPVGLIFIAYTFYTQNQTISTRSIVTNTAIWTLCGLAYGATMWHYFNRKYIKLRTQQPPHNQSLE